MIGKILMNCWKFVKFVNIFPRQKFALYGTLLEISEELQIVPVAMGHSKMKDSFIVNCEWSTF